MRPPPLFQNYRGFSSFFRQIDLQDLYITLGSGLDEMGLEFLDALGCATSPPSETTVVATQTATPSSTSPAPRGDERSKRPALRHEEALQREPSASGPPRSAGSWWTLDRQFLVGTPTG